MRKPDPIVAALKARRKELGLTLRQVADAAGVYAQQISRWENGGGIPQLDMVRRWSGVFDMEPGLLEKEAPDGGE